MTFVSLVVKNLLRRKIRTFLTAFGISLGVATIIALSAIGSGMQQTVGKILKAGGADFMVAQAGSADLVMGSLISEDKVSEIKKMKGVKDAVGVLIGVANIENLPFFLVFGAERDSFYLKNIGLNGKLFKAKGNSELILGKIAAENFKKSTGSSIKIWGKNFKVIGIYETGDVLRDGGAILPLDEVQKNQKREDKVTMILVKIEENVDAKEVSKAIEDHYSGELVAVKSLAEVGKVDQGTKAIGASVWAISLLAIIIGGIGVLNTMMMSVFERTREIGVLRAVGWERQRVLILILCESLLLCLLGFLIGTAIGISIVKLVMIFPATKGLLDPQFEISLFQQALFVALVVSIIGGLYPAYKASKLLPQEALRYE